jgi:diguanylate cyclase (GGDEF)-like protein
MTLKAIWQRVRGIRNFSLGISAKLYCCALFSLVAVALLSYASIHFSNTTKTAVYSLYVDGFRNVLNSTRLEQLLEHHRRIVESMPLEVNRRRLKEESDELKRVEDRLFEIIKGIVLEDRPLETDGLERNIALGLPQVFAAAGQVAFFANEFAQDKAVEHVEKYVELAERTQRQIKNYRELRIQEAQESIELINSTAKLLMVVVLICALLAVVLIGPIGLATMHGVLSRLKAVTHAMVTLAKNDTSVVIPSSHDHDEVGAMARAVGVFKENAIQLLSREQELKQLNNRIDIALNNMTHGLSMFDASQRLIVCNRTYVQMYNLPKELAEPGVTLREIELYRKKIGNSALVSPEEVAATSGMDSALASAFNQELADGRTIAVSQRPMADGGWVAVHEDITERRRAESKIAHLARHDMLTNLPNRLLFREHLEETFASAPLDSHCAVHCLDLDNFKTVNDTLGHAVGDELLKAVALRLSQTLSSEEFVARIGGDEFAIVQLVNSKEECGSLAKRVIQVVSQPYDIEGRHIVIGTSIGIAIAPQDGPTPEQLLKNADMALYLAKGDGRGTFRYFEQGMDKRLQARRLLELDLRKAIAKGDLELHYQPIIKLSTEKVCGFEALLRWKHPERGYIPPSEFIPLAEETGLILSLGEWILRTACSHAAKWPEPVSVAVNLSATQFKGRNIVQLALSALASTGLDPNRLDLEITESVLLEDEANTLTVLRQLRELGIRISLDDFGTGYSSLAYLRNFPFDKIKIDRSFVADMLVRKDCRAIVQAVVGLARSLGITTVIEGVETREQFESAKIEGCDEGQGFLFSKAIPNSQVCEYFEKRGAAIKAA